MPTLSNFVKSSQSLHLPTKQKMLFSLQMHASTNWWFYYLQQITDSEICVDSQCWHGTGSNRQDDVHLVSDACSLFNSSQMFVLKFWHFDSLGKIDWMHTSWSAPLLWLVLVSLFQTDPLQLWSYFCKGKKAKLDRCHRSWLIFREVVDQLYCFLK